MKQPHGNSSKRTTVTRRDFLQSCGASAVTFGLAGTGLASAGPARAGRIAVDCADRLGSASGIANFLGCQGGLLTWDDWEIEAWRNLGLTHCSQTLFDDKPETGAGLGLHVTRGESPPGSLGPLGPQQDLYLDTSDFEAALSVTRDRLGIAEPVFEVNWMPKALSSKPDAEEYWTYAPDDYREWSAVLRAAISFLREQCQVLAPAFGLYSEPETYDIWKGQDRPEGSFKILTDYVRFYAWTWEAIKTANRNAQVGGPSSACYSSTLHRQLGGGPWGLDDFLQELRFYNTRHARNPIGLDWCIWQDFNSENTRRLWKGVEHVRRVLAANNFPEDTAQVLFGWNAEWAGLPPQREPRPNPSHWKAVHFVSNVIDQLNPGGQPGLSRAFWYTWNLDGSAPEEKGFSLVSTIHPEIKMSPTLIVPASTSNRKHAAYAAFQMLHALRGGELVRASKDRNSPLDALAALENGGPVRAVLANNTDHDYAVTLSWRNVPWPAGTQIRATVQRLGAPRAHSNNGGGLEKGVKLARVRVPESRLVSISLPGAPNLPARSARLMTLTPA